ncbi:MAG: hypothetical protein JXB15_14200 [Anaerolineales bacterium]|nr:hypothetical protein [Anaerolineales bacterium]
MRLCHLFTINIFFAIIIGGSCVILPSFTMWLYGLTPDEPTLWVTRLVGGSILGYATLMWYGRSSASADARMAIALALLAQDAIGFVASLAFQLTGMVNAFGWLSLALYGLLALGYAYFLFIRPQDC